MKLKIMILSAILLLGWQVSNAENGIVITGHVASNGEHLPFINVTIKGTTIGVATDANGHYKIPDCPSGQVILVASALGYKTKEFKLQTEPNKSYEIKFDLEEDALNIDEVVITGDKEARKRREALTIVNVISPKLMDVTQSVTLSEGLNFSTGLRMETNCQNCGFSQVRMNGMEGSYSQILINSRPIFSGLAGVYGLELIPSNMIEKVEIVRGGGSALYGSNAIAGTINMILKDQLSDSYEIGINSGIVGVGIDGSGSSSNDNSINFSSSVISDDFKRGLSVFGFHRKQGHFDVDNDGFSELTDINNTTVGTRLFNQFGHRGKITFNYFHINEKRRGGNEFKKPEHEAGIAESLSHKINSGSLVYDQFFREQDKLSVYLSAQSVDRDSYYGADQDLSAYGITNDLSYNFGASYNAKFGVMSSVTVGVENTGGWLKDEKPGYYTTSLDTVNMQIVETHTDNVTISDQQTNTTGMFAQYTLKYNKFTATVGGRFDMYNVKNNKEDNQDHSGTAFIPRVNLLYDVLPSLQLRASYSQGYRAPQMFDEDLHIVVAGAKQIRSENSADLKKETSNSYMLSADFNKQFGNAVVGLLVEGFYTKLNDAFVSSPEMKDDGTLFNLRTNAEDGAVIAGVNTELKLMPFADFSIVSGLTIQKSEYTKEQDVDDFGITKEKRILRTPDVYGFTTLDWDIAEKFEISVSGNYMGKMLTPYAGTEFKNDEERAIGKQIEDETVASGQAIEDAPYNLIRETPAFFDVGAKFSYSFKVKGAGIKVFTGIKNIMQSYQTDFDKGTARDAGYIYGPRTPRTIYFGLKIGNLL